MAYRELAGDLGRPLADLVGKRTQRQDSRQQEVNKVVLAVDDVGT